MEKGRTFENGYKASEEFPEYIDHWFYFPLSPDAEMAAELLRQRGWSTKVDLGADGVDWLVLSTQPATGDEDMEDIFSELEALAERCNGTYDGYERPMGSGDFVQ